MLGEILETVEEFVEFADRNLTILFSEPWPPPSPEKQQRAVYARQRNYCTSSRRATTSSRAMDPGQTSRPQLTAGSYPGRARQNAPSSQNNHNDTTRPVTKLRKSTIASRQNVRAPATHASVSSAIPPRPISAPAVVRKTDIRDIRVLSKPHPVEPRRTRSLRLDDFRPDLAKCDVLIRAIADMEICKEIFAGWRAQLDLGEPGKDALELSIVAAVRRLDVRASDALRSSHSLLRNYKALLNAIERNLHTISQSELGGSPFSLEISSLSTSISVYSRNLSRYVKEMQERLRTLVKDIEKTKESADKRALKKKIWKWLARVLKVLATLMSAGGALFALVHPIGFLESVVIGAASMLTGAIARLCEIAEEKYSETMFDQILALLRSDVPESAKAAEFALTSFQACHRLLQVELEVRKGGRSGWVSAADARRARGQWAKAAGKLNTQRSAK